MATVAVSAHPLKPMMLLTASAVHLAKPMKSGILLSVLAAACLLSTLSVESVLNVMLILKSTIKNCNAVIALMVIIKYQVKVAMVFALLSAILMKIGFQVDVSANLDTILSIISVLNAQPVRSMTSIKEFAEYNVEQIKSTTSIAANAIALKATTLSRVPALNVFSVRPTTPTHKHAALFHALVLMNTTAIPLSNVSASLSMFVSEVFAPIVLLDITMIATLINADASLASEKKVDSATPSAHQIKPILMVCANATMEPLFTRANVLSPISAPSTATSILKAVAVSAMQVSLSSMGNAAATSTVV